MAELLEISKRQTVSSGELVLATLLLFRGNGCPQGFFDGERWVSIARQDWIGEDFQFICNDQPSGRESFKRNCNVFPQNFRTISSRTEQAAVARHQVRHSVGNSNTWEGEDKGAGKSFHDESSVWCKLGEYVGDRKLPMPPEQSASYADIHSCDKTDSNPWSCVSSFGVADDKFDQIKV